MGPALDFYNHSSFPMEQHECSPLSTREMQAAPATPSCALLHELEPLAVVPDVTTSREHLTHGKI